MADLQALLRYKQPVGICLQETKLAPGSRFSLPGYTLYRKDIVSDTIAHGGVAIAVRNNLAVIPLALTVELQAVAARIHIGNRFITLCSIYLPPGGPLPHSQLTHLVSELPPPFFLLGDFNCHNTVWGCQGTDSRGRLLERLFYRENLCILNTGERTHITLPSGRTTVLDLSLCSPQLVPSITWEVLDDPLSSDHFPVVLHYNDTAVVGSRPSRWNFKKADMNRFQAEVEEVFAQRPPDDPLSVEYFTGLLLEAAHTSIPRTSGRPRRPPVPWWNDACRDAIRARRRAFKRFNKHSTEANLIAFKQARTVVRRTVLEAKRSSWMSYIKKLNRSSPTTQIYTQIKRIAGQSVVTPLPVLRMNGVDIADPMEVANQFGHALSERCKIGNDPRFAIYKTHCERQQIRFFTSELLSYNQPFSMRELEWAISELRSVAEGPDFIHNDMLKVLPRSAKEVLLGIFNAVWESGEFPASWREAIIVPLLKPGKSGLDPFHYRPVSLTSCLCKLMEKMVNVRFTWFLEQGGILTNSQCGFRKGRSTVDHLITLDTVVRAAFQKRRHVGAIFFDLEGAYDTTWRYGVLSKAWKCGIRGHLGFFIANFFISPYIPCSCWWHSV